MGLSPRFGYFAGLWFGANLRIWIEDMERQAGSIPFSIRVILVIRGFSVAVPPIRKGLNLKSCFQGETRNHSGFAKIGKRDFGTE